MTKEKKVNLIWVIVLVPIVLNVFGTINAAMIPEIGLMLKAIVTRLIAIAVLTFIPYAGGRLIKG